MRTAIWQYLTDNCRSVKTWKQPYIAEATTPKPYGVVSFLGDAPALSNAMGAFDEVRVWIYDEPGDLVSTDAAINEVKHLLDGQLLTTGSGIGFSLEWINTSRDFYDDALQALTKYATFRVPKLRIWAENENSTGDGDDDGNNDEEE